MQSKWIFSSFPSAFLAGCLFWISAQQLAAQDTSDALVTELKELVTKLEKKTNTTTELKTLLSNLKVQINKLLDEEPSDIEARLTAAAQEIGQNQDVSDIAEEIEALRLAVLMYQARRLDDAIQKRAAGLLQLMKIQNDPHTSNTRKTLLDLRSEIDKAEQENILDAIRRRAKELNDYIGLSTKVTAAELSLGELSTLLQTLQDIEGKSFLKALNARSEVLTSMIEKPAEIRPFLRVSELKALAALQTKIVAVLGEDTTKTPGIHVVSAHYGLISDHNKLASTLCDVETIMVKQCQGLTNCTISAQSPLTFCSKADLGAFTDSRSLGVSVDYICLNATKSEWQDFMAGRASPDLTEKRTAVLRGTSDLIRCALN